MRLQPRPRREAQEDELMESTVRDRIREEFFGAFQGQATLPRLASHCADAGIFEGLWRANAEKEWLEGIVLSVLEGSGDPIYKYLEDHIAPVLDDAGRKGMSTSDVAAALVREGAVRATPGSDDLTALQAQECKRAIMALVEGDARGFATPTTERGSDGALVWKGSGVVSRDEFATYFLAKLMESAANSDLVLEEIRYAQTKFPDKSEVWESHRAEMMRQLEETGREIGKVRVQYGQDGFNQILAQACVLRQAFDLMER